MNAQSRKYLYTKSTFTYIIKNNFIIGFFYLFDFLAIFSFICTVPQKITFLNKYYDEKDIYMYYLSPFNLYKQYLPTTNTVYMISLISVVIFLIFVYYLLYLTLTKDSVNSTDIKMELFKKIYINFYEFILFRALILYIFDSYITAIVECIYKSYEKNGSVYGIIEFFYSSHYFI